MKEREIEVKIQVAEPSIGTVIVIDWHGPQPALAITEPGTDGVFRARDLDGDSLGLCMGDYGREWWYPRAAATRVRTIEVCASDIDPTETRTRRPGVP